MTDDHGHVPVLPDATLELLAPRPGETAVDCTVGRGGHARLLAECVAPGGRLIGFDLDPANVAHAQDRLGGSGAAVEIIRAPFARAPEELTRRGLRADVLLADLGFASSQMDDPERGLSMRAEGPLDMRLDPEGPITAADLLASASEAELADWIYEYGEDPYARKIARKLAQAREREPIQSTTQLARLVLDAYGPRARSSRMHPATRTFMALRIAVNDELGALDALLDAVRHGAERAPNGWLNVGARIAVIGFHSLEDRRVKHAFAELDRRGLATRLTKKPVMAEAQEVHANPRARSARLRVLRLNGRGDAPIGSDRSSEE